MHSSSRSIASASSKKSALHNSGGLSAGSTAVGAIAVFPGVQNEELGAESDEFSGSLEFGTTEATLGTAMAVYNAHLHEPTAPVSVMAPILEGKSFDEENPNRKAGLAAAPIALGAAGVMEGRKKYLKRSIAAMLALLLLLILGLAIPLVKRGAGSNKVQIQEVFVSEAPSEAPTSSAGGGSGDGNGNGGTDAFHNLVSEDSGEVDAPVVTLPPAASTSVPAFSTTLPPAVPTDAPTMKTPETKTNSATTTTDVSPMTTMGTTTVSPPTTTTSTVSTTTSTSTTTGSQPATTTTASTTTATGDQSTSTLRTTTSVPPSTTTTTAIPPTTTTTASSTTTTITTSLPTASTTATSTTTTKLITDPLTSSPSSFLSRSPSVFPSKQPTSAPSTRPSVTLSKVPTAAPSVLPSSKPSLRPSSAPSAAPSVSPSATPSPVPTITPPDYCSFTVDSNPNCPYGSDFVPTGNTTSTECTGTVTQAGKCSFCRVRDANGNRRFSFNCNLPNDRVVSSYIYRTPEGSFVCQSCDLPTDYEGDLSEVSLCISSRNQCNGGPR